MKKSMNEQIAEQLIAQLEAGTSPFQQTGFKMPVNPTTGKNYRGMTALQLALLDKADPRWMTLRQASNAKWKIEKGSKGTLINFQKTQDRVRLLDEDGNVKLNSKQKPMTQLIKLEKPVMTNAFVFNADQIEDIPALAEFLEERAARHPEKGTERLDKIAEKAEEAVPELRVRELPFMALINELAEQSGLALAEGVVENPVADEIRTAMASMLIADALGLDQELDPNVDVTEWIDLLKERPELLEGIVTQAQYVADDILKLEPKREQQQTSHADRTLQVGDQIPYNESTYEVVGKLKKNDLQVKESSTGNKFRVSPGDGIYNSLLQAKKQMQQAPQQSEQAGQDMSNGINEDRSPDEEHAQEQEDEMDLVLNQDAAEGRSAGRKM